jgi:peroxiredoxin Q/BCP
VQEYKMSETLCVGEMAPVFALPASNGTRISLMDYRDKKSVVLYFYPKDMTTGCTLEAVAFRDLQNEFDLANAAILGVSTDDLASHDKFATQNNITFPLLSDTDGRVADLFGVLKSSETPKAVRSTFVIGKDGKILKIYNNVRIECHADEVLAFLHGLKGTQG